MRLTLYSIYYEFPINDVPLSKPSTFKISVDTIATASRVLTGHSQRSTSNSSLLLNCYMNLASKILDLRRREFNQLRCDCLITVYAHRVDAGLRVRHRDA